MVLHRDEDDGVAIGWIWWRGKKNRGIRNRAHKGFRGAKVDD